ncbi:MAG: hypothetical protein AAGD32_15075 [Planctomycetota bacterium]
MRCLLLALILFVPGLSASAQVARTQQAQRQLLEDVAREAARRELGFEIRNTELLPGVTVGRYLDDTGQSERLQDALSRAEIIGGARWLTADVCQFHLQLDGRLVSDLLVGVARQGGPLRVDDVAKGSRAWFGRPFVATGTAIDPVALETLNPPASAAAVWRGVSRDARVRAIRAAHAAAVASAGPAATAQTPVTQLRFYAEASDACVEVELLSPATGEAFFGTATVLRTPVRAGEARTD